MMGFVFGQSIQKAKVHKHIAEGFKRGSLLVKLFSVCVARRSDVYCTVVEEEF